MNLEKNKNADAEKTYKERKQRKTLSEKMEVGKHCLGKGRHQKRMKNLFLENLFFTFHSSFQI